ncbi:MAG: hypothetical protein M1828_001655 [Chrysothrix sp. TS-e1954]|nr:MAG: hypothetical protein M1828_001655 [Chrysothrix sp. TS-e1954]
MMTIGNIYVIAAIAVVGGGLFGFDISSMSAILGTNSYKCYFNQGPEGPPYTDSMSCSGPTSLNQGGITAAMAAGSWLGALISGFISDTLGRKKSIIIGCVIWVIGSIIIAASQNIGMLVVGRIINGLCQWAITWGILIMFYISYGCAYIGGQNSNNYNTASFRVPWALQMIPAIFLFCMMFFMPESPRWLARKGRWDECLQVLALVHAKGNKNAPLVQFEYDEIKEMVEFERQNADVTYLELFKPNMINRTHIGIFTQIWSQLTGMNVMMYYITYVFGMAGYSGNANLLASSIQYVINVFMTIPALIYVDRWGRRPTLLIGGAFMMTWMYANAGILASHGMVVDGGVGGVPEESMKVSGAAAKGLIACTYLFVASYAPSWGPVSWIYPPELYPLRVRGKAVALATSFNWAFNTALGLFVPTSFENIRWETYIIFGVFLTAMWIHVFFLFPETAGKTLEETEAMFTDPKGPKYIGTLAWKTHVQTARVSAIERGHSVDVENMGKESSSGEQSPDRIHVHADEKA